MMVIANSEFSKTTRAIEARSREALQEVVDQCQRRLSEQKKAVQARAKADKAKLGEEEKAVRALEANVGEIEKQLAAMEGALRR